MVDNFELIKSMFYFNEANDMFFHCQIVQRAKDHKGEKVREGAIKTYFIKSLFMRLIKPSFEILDQQCGLEGIYKQIEIAGRTCYKSEDKITEDSAKGFVDRMVKSGHGATLEHGTVYLRIPINEYEKNYKNKYFPQE